MKSSYKRLGRYIERCDEFNSGMHVKKLLGISNNKKFQKAQTNTNGINLEKYRIVRTNQFAFNRATTRNGEKISIALRKGNDCIVSPSYRIFKSVDENVLDSDYLMMWFRRPEFDRYARFKSHGSAHEFFDYDEMCEIMLPVPSIQEQREIVKEYNIIADRIKVNELLNQKLEETAQALYKYWFVDFEFPFDFAQGKFDRKDGKPYRSSGGAMIYNVDLDKEIPEGWEAGSLEDLVSFSRSRIGMDELTLSNYISTENMNPYRKGVTEAANLPSCKTVTRFYPGDILISNIRPYFKKIWSAEFEGGCSNDILCFKVRNEWKSMYVYYILEQDLFFDYVMAGSKGTKMPRGDKEWIMNYQIVLPTKGLVNEFATTVDFLSRNMARNFREIKVLKQLKMLLLSKMATVEEQIEATI